ncbi:MAG: glycosyltransferase family 4 protein [Bacteroidota bacterium]
MSARKRIVLLSPMFLDVLHFRLPLLRALRERGYETTVAATPGEGEAKVAAEGIECRRLYHERGGMNPLREVKVIYSIYQLYTAMKPDIVINYSVKLNIYGAIAARFAKVPVINVVSGLGYIFVRDTLASRIGRALLRFSLRYAAKIIALNPDDAHQLVAERFADPQKLIQINGEGIDTAYFSESFCVNTQKDPSKFIFLLIARMVYDKGVLEFVEAASRIAATDSSVLFWLLGPLDAQIPSAISAEQLKKWERCGIVRYLGVTDDVRPFICKSDCVVLPSYREGMSRVLLEAASMQKPIITTDVPGCRQIVQDGVNGFLVKPRDAESLANAMRRMVALPEQKRAEMGKRGRELVLKEFSNEKVVTKFLNVIDEVLSGCPASAEM